MSRIAAAKHLDQELNALENAGQPRSNAGLGPSWLLFAATIYFGAFFLFELEPLIAKEILPWHGGSAQVWATCLVFFQVALFAGYLYAHLLIEWLNRDWQVRVHVSLLTMSLFFLPVIPAEHWKPVGGEDPLFLILGLLIATIGLPFVLLSATSPLVQAWFARANAGEPAGPDAEKKVGRRSTYRFFALSNLGSMMALLSYPLLVEPFLRLTVQAWVWSVGYFVFVVLSIATALYYRTKTQNARTAASVGDEDAPSWTERAMWFGLAAVPSALLIAVTNFILQNIAAIPLFYIVPLALYLLSFIFAFGNLRWYWPPMWYAPFIGAVGFMIVGMSDYNPLNNLFFAIALFVCCLVCHGELAMLRPRIRNLTGYYLTISAGGATGGLFVAIFAPAVFNANYDLAILIPATSLMVLLCVWHRYRHVSHRLFRAAAFGFLSCFLAFETFYVARVTYLDQAGAELLVRNFYGALKVSDYEGEAPRDRLRKLVNGAIEHGQQFTAPDRQLEPTAYYGWLSGIGLALDGLAAGEALHVGGIGLGAGTIAAYGRAQDRYRFYEINPLVLEIADENFWYLDRSPAETEVVLGDARLSLERESAQAFDVLAVDAFLGDAIPIHLLTREAFALYWRHLKPDGVLAIHVSNRFVDLAAIVAAGSIEFGKTIRLIENEPDAAAGTHNSKWVLVTSRPGFFDRPSMQSSQPISIPDDLDPWTDDHSDLWRVLVF